MCIMPPNNNVALDLSHNTTQSLGLTQRAVKLINFTQLFRVTEL